MVSHLKPGEDFRLGLFHYRSCQGVGLQGPLGKDNIPILQLKWISGKMKNLATFQPYACLQRHQPLL
jgi:hypothetical protein